MAKGIKGSTPSEEDKPHKTTFIVDPALMKKVRYIALMDETEMTGIVKEALSDYVQKWEKKNGPIPVK